MSLSLIKSWVFDLDNTLYDPEEDIFSQIDKKMTSFISKRFDINTNDAFNIQKEYFLEYGTTLAGLMNDKNSNIDPDEFLEYVHNIDLKSLNPNLELKKAITNLIGPKFIFTNGTKYHAENVIRKLDLENVFEFIFDIKAANYIPKPNIETYDSFFESTGINPKTSIMFEDMGRNLIPAKDLGMTTVLIKREIPNQDNIFQDKKYSDIWGQDVPADYIIDDLAKFLNNI
ncbi:pyrimidine 5'-nucleotidase [Rhodobiaceae bacterium]|nr:pyrimidine 5'-nucleotidase [Rhodobiaceae bacterium]MDC0184915.1 pyrimidine 5'-nucleotidase [Rhodobiaceae bacterium]|tara:strand:- start:5933 stop:6619 length:687 start_codon:yes stop_codon:yes gene_type:complete